MTDEMMSLRTLLEKSSDADLLREMVEISAIVDQMQLSDPTFTAYPDAAEQVRHGQEVRFAPDSPLEGGGSNPRSPP
jgi:hypothetical protein